MSKFPTSKENIVLDLISNRLGESFINRTPEEYEAIKAWVNDGLKAVAAAGAAPHKACYFKVGDRHAWYAPYPTNLSIEVVRSALVNSGFREKQIRKRKGR